MPDFKRPTLDGGAADTASLRGRVVVVKFFAKYCEPCKKTLPAAESLSKDHPDVTFIGVAEDEDEADVREVVATYGVTFPVVHDRGQVLSGRYRVRDMPVTFVVSREGSVRWVGDETQTEAALDQAIRAVAR